jgi:formiminotetrahydrofolate cyclodeaminase
VSDATSGLSSLAASLAVGDPPEGAGVVAGGVCELAAGLCESLARASLNDWPGARGAAVQAATLRARAGAAREANARAYAAARESLARPSVPGETGRDAGLRAALLSAADTLLSICAAAGDCAGLAAEVAEGCDPGLKADAAGAAGLAAAAAQAAAGLVAINLAVLPDDERREQVVAIMAGAKASLDRAVESARGA